MIFGNKEQILYGNRFNGTKGNGYQPIKKVMTNEEWIKSMNTEQLAKRLHNNDVYAFFVCKNGGKVPSVESYVEWLKQPHTPKE